VPGTSGTVAFLQAFAVHAALQVQAVAAADTVASMHGCRLLLSALQARLYKEVASRAQSGMRVLYPLCSLRVMTSGAGDTTPRPGAAANSDAPGAAAGVPDCSVGTHSHVLQIQQSLDDGLYHDDDEAPNSISLLAANIAGVQSMVANFHIYALHLCMSGALSMTALKTLLFGPCMQACSSAPHTAWVWTATHSAQPLLCR
jgi:hypothetical protein